MFEPKSPHNPQPNYPTVPSWLRHSRLLPMVDAVAAAIMALRNPLAVLVLAGIASLLCGLFVAPQGYVLCGAISMVIAIGCCWPWIALRGVDCQLTFQSARTEEGKPTVIKMLITNRWPWPVWGLAIEGGLELPSDEESVASAKPAIAVAQVSGWSKSKFEVPFVPMIRGQYPLSPPRLVTEFPFGLWKVGKPVKVFSKLIVWPRRFRLPPLTMPNGQRSWTGQPCEMATGRLGQRTSVREYRLGDSIRQIHWAKTAAHDRLISYDREGHAVLEALVSVDTHPNLHRGAGADASVEWALRIAASVCDALIHQRIRVQVIAHAGRFTTKSLAGTPVALLDWLATLETAKERNIPSAESRRSRSRSGALSIHITTDRSPSISGDSIVLTDETTSDAPAKPKARCWMTVVDSRDIESQVRYGWQRTARGCRNAS